MNMNRNGRSYANLTMPVALGISSRGVQTSITGGSSNFIHPTWQSFNWPDGENLERLTKFQHTELNDMVFYFVEDFETDVQHVHDSVTSVRLVEKGTTLTGPELKTLFINYLGDKGERPVPNTAVLVFCKGQLLVLSVLVNRTDFLVVVRSINEDALNTYDIETATAATEMLLEVFSKYTPEQAAQALMHKRMKELPRARCVLEAILQGITLTGTDG